MSLLHFIDSKLDGNKWKITPPDIQQARDAAIRFTRRAIPTPEFDYDWLFDVSAAIEQGCGMAFCIEDQIAASKMLNSLAAIRDALIEWMRENFPRDNQQEGIQPATRAVDNSQPVESGPPVEEEPPSEKTRPRDAKYLAAIADVSVKTITDIVRGIGFPRRIGRPKSGAEPFEYAKSQAAEILRKTLEMPSIRRNLGRSVIVEMEIRRLENEIEQELKCLTLARRPDGCAAERALTNRWDNWKNRKPSSSK